MAWTKEQHREYQRKYHEENREKRIAACKARYHRNKEAISKAWRERYANDPELRKKQQERQRAWRLANPKKAAAIVLNAKAKKREKYRSLHRAWRERNPEKTKQEWTEERKRVHAAWVKKNPDRRALHNRKWLVNNRDKVNATYANRRAKKLNATPAWANKFFISEAYHLARLRTKATGFQWHVDHIVPLVSSKVCGLHVEHNLQVIPGKLNQSKCNRHWPDMPT